MEPLESHFLLKTQKAVYDILMKIVYHITMLWHRWKAGCKTTYKVHRPNSVHLYKDSWSNHWAYMHRWVSLSPLWMSLFLNFSQEHGLSYAQWEEQWKWLLWLQWFCQWGFHHSGDFLCTTSTDSHLETCSSAGQPHASITSAGPTWPRPGRVPGDHFGSALGGTPLMLGCSLSCSPLLKTHILTLFVFFFLFLLFLNHLFLSCSARYQFHHPSYRVSCMY